ncbi:MULTISPECIES: hypothetical protein [unclassified Microbacterium]|uniref:hypothetical protein n=1 Tax=unclassified Microbacterium TaxID=2609290 RepID=UPI00214C7746|nr:MULTISPECIES: hypothetical protein [unclassified Microbacterium]MCR2784685.1 hypothetical protein [Microbacterium sp. zg.B96]MDL5352863.1 hypothetical protein [Microbacterium sp. zg-YB36]WIM16227.1 hypothetical protein QNO11_00925 [Microbacterium sp. zg-B96]
MTRETVRRRRIAIVDGARRHDLVVPVHARVDDAVRAVGAHPGTGAGAVVEIAGRQIAPDTLLGDLEDGTVLMLVDISPAPGRGRGRPRVGSLPPADLPTPTWWVLAGAGAVLAAVVLFTPTGDFTSVRRLAGAAAAVAAMLAGTVFAVRAPRGRRAPLAPTIAVLVLGFAAGAALVPPVPASGGVLAVFVGTLFAATLAGIMGTATPSPTLRAESRTAMAVLLVIAVVWGAALLWRMDAAAPAAVTLGLIPAGHRLLLATVVDVPPGTFIDYARFQTTRWTVRQQLPEEVLFVDDDEARRLVQRSTARLLTGVLLLVVAGVAAAPIALPSFPSDDPLVLVGRIALGVTVVLSLLLGARRATVPALRWISRLGAAAVLLVMLIALIPSADTRMLTVVAALALAAGAASAFLVIPAGRGVRSLAWSRAGDALEWIAVALSLPAAFLAADVVDALRAMMAA